MESEFIEEVLALTLKRLAKKIVGRDRHSFWHRYIYEKPSQKWRNELISNSRYPSELKAYGENFVSDGLLVLPEFFKGPELKALQDEFEKLLNTNGKECDHGEFQIPRNPLVNSQTVLKAALDPLLLDIQRFYWGKDLYMSDVVASRIEPIDVKDYGSFQWHHDGKRKYSKTFILLSDLEPDGQRTEYIVGSHKNWHKDWDSGRDSRFPSDRFEGDQKRASITGKAGTVAFLDANGFHRGNRNSTARRDLLSVCFTAGEMLYHFGEIENKVFDELSDLQRSTIDRPPTIWNK